MSGNDCGLDVAAAIQHVTKHLLQARERSLPGNVVGWTNLFGCDQAEGAANGLRRVMERGLERDLGVMQPVGVELNFGAAGAAAEEIDGAALADHFNGPLPGF